MIVSHGSFVRYQPGPGEIDPQDVPALDAGMWFYRNEAGADFYALRRTMRADGILVWLRSDGSIEGCDLSPRDSALPGPGRTIYELTDHEVADPQDIVGQRLDLSSGAIEPMPGVVVVPASATKLGLKRALAETGSEAVFAAPQWPAVKAAIASSSELQEDWDLATEIRRSDPLTQAMIASLQLTEEQVDQLLIRAAALVA